MRVTLAASIAALALVVAPDAVAQPLPFGHPCTTQDGVRFCPTTDLASRVRSWDGVPLDVDVTLPSKGNGPFPTILLLHGLGQTKTAFEGTSGDPLYNNVFFARHGYAVVTPTARGFGNSCGVPASRTAGCAQGWTRLGDIRYEVRDVQYLTGLLVDEGVANRNAIGATGISYGGGFSTMLAFLRDRIRLPDGRLAPWKSPKGKRIHLTAAWPRWLWTNGASIFARNGRGSWSRTPQGVPTQAWANLIFGVADGGFVAPPGSVLSANINRWKALLDAGTVSPEATAVLSNSFLYHGVASLTGRTAAILFQAGWTDGLFPVPQALAGYDALLQRDPTAPVAMQVGDLGHMPANNHPIDTARFDAQGLKFFDAWLRGKGRKPSPGSVTARTMTCPRTAPAGGGPYVASSFNALARRSLGFGTSKTLRIDSSGASADLAKRLSATTVNLCTPQAPDPTSRATFSRKSLGVTLIGLPVLTGRVTTAGRYGQIDARVWDLDPATNTELLITRGVYRLTDNERGAFRFVLDGNGWRFAPGHRIVVELLGRDAPTYRPSPTPFSARLRDLKIMLPIR
jgi:X-Pro dipeptidyl-peptidase (S15 family)